MIQFESANEKEKIREELRLARGELLRRAQKNAEHRAERSVNEKLRGDTDWIHPSIVKKLDKSVSKLKKVKTNKSKEKKSKKHKKEKSKKKKRNQSFSTDSSDDEEIIKKKRKKNKYSTDESSSSNSSSESEAEWVEKVKTSKPLIRDDWMKDGLLLKTYSKEKDNKNDKEKQNIDSYDPSQSSRELNPHWRDGGSGLPSFQKPKDDADDFSFSKQQKNTDRGRGNWRKKDDSNVNKEFQSNSLERKHYSTSKGRHETTNSSTSRRSPSSSSIESDIEKEPIIDSNSKVICSSNFLTDQQMNELGAKLIKAEIMGDNELVEELKLKLANARTTREKLKEKNKQDFLKTKGVTPTTPQVKDEHILLTATDSRGMSRPLLNRNNQRPSDPYGKRSGNRKNKSAKVETHTSGERVRYFPDDDRYDIKQMFEREKYTTANEADSQFAEIAGKHKNPNDDLEDIFADKVRKGFSESDKMDKEKNRAIYEHEKLSKKLDNCDKCFDSFKMEKQLLVSMGDYAYLSLPWHEGIQAGHCQIIPMQHIACSTQLDENIWEEINNFRKSLTRMFAAKKQDVIFFETASYLHKRPHMVIHCVPGNFEMAPFYFKKAIQESEYEWSTNKQLVTLKEKNLRQSIPKGLPYFWVNFGMDTGFAHVIEDQERFPSNFAQEIIGGMLHLDPKKWRKPRKELNIIPKVKQLADWWKPYDFTMPE